MKNDSDIKPVTGEYQEFKLEDLHIQYIPVVTPIKAWKYNMGIPSSPHVELMRIFKHAGFDWGRIKYTRYVQERQKRKEIGLSNWSEKNLIEHLKRRYALFKSLKKFGFKKNLRGEKPVRVFEKPFWTTRFNYEQKWLNGPEIWDGGGVCTALYALGHKTVKGILVEDKYPGTEKRGRFKEKLKNIKGVF